MTLLREPVPMGPGWEGSFFQAICRKSAISLAGGLLAASLCGPAWGHVAPSGWVYPIQCCSNQDCEPVHGTGVLEGPQGYVVQDTGETIGCIHPA